MTAEPMTVSRLLSAGGSPAPGGGWRLARSGGFYGCEMAVNGLLAPGISVKCTSDGTPATGSVAALQTARGRGRLVRSRRDQPYLCVLPRPSAGGGSLMASSRTHPPGCECGVHNRPRQSPEEVRARAREAHRIKMQDPEYRAERREQEKARRAANPEKERAARRAWYQGNRAKVLDQKRVARQLNPELANQRQRSQFHGLSPEDTARKWIQQHGCCCYCGDELPRERRRVHVDHDHACCPPGRSCAYCQRGLACDRCNSVVGFGLDDPDRLERIAANLRRLKAEARERIAGKPVQGELPLNVLPLKRTEEAG